MSGVEEAIGNGGDGFLNWIIMLVVAYMVVTQLGFPAAPILAFVQGSAAVGGLDVTLLLIGVGLFLKRFWYLLEGGVTFAFFAGVMLLMLVLK